jgi:hypothetical protein
MLEILVRAFGGQGSIVLTSAGKRDEELEVRVGGGLLDNLLCGYEINRDGLLANDVQAKVEGLDD